MPLVRKKMKMLALSTELSSVAAGIGDRIRQCRNDLGLDQGGLSAKSGVSRAMISDFERATRIPNADHLFLLSRALGVRFNWLFSGEGPSDANSPSQTDLRNMVHARLVMRVDFVATSLSMLRSIPPSAASFAAGIRASLWMYLGEQGAFVTPVSDMAYVVERMADHFGLALANLVDELPPCVASRDFLLELEHLGVSPVDPTWIWPDAAGVHSYQPVRFTAQPEAEVPRRARRVDVGLQAYLDRELAAFRAHSAHST